MPTLTICPDTAVLQRLILGQIPAADSATLEEHVAVCMRCADTLQQLRADDPLVDALRQTLDRAAAEQTPLAAALIPCLKRMRPKPPESVPLEETVNAGPTDPTVAHLPFDF